MAGEGAGERIRKHLEAIALGLAHLARRPLTLRYPEEYEVVEGARGLILFDMAKCIGCSLCAQICPARAIKMYRLPGVRTPRPGIDYTRCIFCGFCVDICPTGALYHGEAADMVIEEPSKAVLTPVEWDEFKPRPWAEGRGRPVRGVPDEEVGLRYEPVGGGGPPDSHGDERGGRSGGDSG